MRWLALVLACGCASAGSPDRTGADANTNGGQDGSVTTDTNGTSDSSMQMADASPDAPPQPVMVTLTQTTNNTVVAANSLACGGCNNTSNPCNSAYTAENAYYRVFALADHAISNALNVTQVTFGVQEAAGAISVQVKLGTYAGTPGAMLNTGATDFAGSITTINTATVNVPATTTGTTVNAAITGTIPAGSNLIVAIFSPTHMGQVNTYFYIGATNAGESKPGYVRAPSCTINSATTTAGVGFPASNLLISVTGTH